MSDSHNDFGSFNLAIKAQPSAEVIIHCGDGASEVTKIRNMYPEKFVVGVRGNCDLASEFPETEILTIDSKKIFVSHGHKYQVKFGKGTIYEKAISEKADILLFGHTHEAFTDYYNGLHIMNPGSLRGIYGSYGTIDITDKGIVTNIVYGKL